ncbi:DUF4058 domain-containing protein [Limnoglobus roseus]|uniref:DUF4058 domain-containing protein n=1 Tax=Limnoglobus roseus TaxID=2598579 RepID=A0A5C1A9L8_9BACT|nr:DUF4058 domain-containing protein [Limnoglobus roseus]QEL15420.1 hypothetical protein PX52LOC_02339 [Limnoglobus roseus]
MSLLDHFRPPLSERRHWHAFHNSWATYLSSQLNARLPEGYFAEANVQFGIEIDVAAFADGPPVGPGWVPPAPRESVPVTMGGPVVEIGIFSRSGGPTLAGAVELVSPANKDRPASREAFVSKCAAYLQAGIGLVIVDVVTERTADLHGELMARLGTTPPPGASLYATAYRPVDRDGAATLDVWHEALTVGRPMPTLPLWLRGGLCLPVELQATYDRTCSEQRLTPPAA